MKETIWTVLVAVSLVVLVGSLPQVIVIPVIYFAVAWSTADLARWIVRKAIGTTDSKSSTDAQV